jgi:hypothetical protein
MKTEKNEGTNGLFTISRQGSGELTHKAVESYVSKGRKLQSEYACKLLYRLYRRVGAILARVSEWFIVIPRGRRRRCGGISGNQEYYY